VGLLKGSAGLLCRPFVGALEGTSKLFYSLALTSLGREGILGRMQVRCLCSRLWGALHSYCVGLPSAHRRQPAPVHDSLHLMRLACGRPATD